MGTKFFALRAHPHPLHLPSPAPGTATRRPSTSRSVGRRLFLHQDHRLWLFWGPSSWATHSSCCSSPAWASSAPGRCTRRRCQLRPRMEARLSFAYTLYRASVHRPTLCMYLYLTCEHQTVTCEHEGRTTSHNTQLSYTPAHNQHSTASLPATGPAGLLAESVGPAPPSPLRPRTPPNAGLRAS